MCTILTDMPLDLVCDERQEVQCGSCQICKKICPAKVIKGTKWSISTVRDDLVNVYQCEQCLRCLAYCRFSHAYAKRYNV